MQFVCPFKSSLRPIPWHGHLAGSSSWLLLTIAEFWEDKLISAFSPLCPVLWSCVWYTCPTTSQEEHFLSIFCFLVTRCWFNLNENEPLFWYCSVVRKCLMYAACWMLTKELALYCCSLIIREWEPITGKWLSFNMVNSWRLFQVCFAEVWSQAGRSCDVGIIGSGQLCDPRSVLQLKRWAEGEEKRVVKLLLWAKKPDGWRVGYVLLPSKIWVELLVK